MSQLLHELIFDASARQPQAPALTFKQDTISYDDLDRQVKSAARGFAGLHLQPRDRIAVYAEKRIETVAAMFGAAAAGGAQQFGVDAERVPQMLGELHKLDLDFIGFHIFAGSQNLNADILLSTQEKIVDLGISLARHAPAPVTHLNIGGGFGIPYFPKDIPLDLARVGDQLAAQMPRLEAELPEARVIVELGRYIVGECGIYVSRIVDRKESRGQVFLITDGGLNHQLAASGNFGQVIRRNYPLAIGNRMDGQSSDVVNVVGCLCTPLDLLADKVELPRAEIGDLVVVFQSGAYGLTASPTAFLSHPAPSEVLV